MRRRNKTGGKPAKTQRSKTLKRRDAPRIARRRKPSAADATETIALLTRERDEALQQQTATAAVLKVMSRSTFDLSKVLNTLVESAARLCEADKARILRPTGKEASYYVAALYGSTTPEYEEHVRTLKLFPGRGSVVGRVLLEGKSVHIPDVLADPEYTLRETARLAGYRTSLGVPLLREGNSIGLLVLQRATVRPFIDKEIELATAFADQAVIAIENTRLLNELRQRTDDLSESLEQQTATSEVLKVISSTPGKLEPVFTAMLDNAVRICEAKFGALFLFEGDAWRAVALHSAAPPLFIEARRRHPVLPITPGTALGRVTATKQVVQIADVRAEPAYLFDSSVKLGVETGDFRTVLSVPMLKEGELVGAFNLFHQEVRQFTDKQIELVKNFAAQAVIAIENARLLNELRESLQQQTATADVLKVISSSSGNLEPIFEAILANATQICRARFGTLNLCEGDALRRVALHNAPPQYAMRRGEEFRPHPAGPLGHVVKTKQIAHIEDIRTVQAYLDGDRVLVGFADLAGARTVLAVPMLKEGELVGVITIFRQEVFPFTDKQIELVKNFAAQAVIAIENVRLLNDLNELNQQLEQRVTDQVSEIERMGRLRRFLPPQVADLIVASGAEKQLESHRREITALFCDLRGFTGFSESSDPEDVMALLREYHAAIGEIISKYGGTLERYAGDGVMVVFNDPIPVDNPALQAVRMAIDMRAAIGTLIEKWRRLGHEIGFGIGLAHGFATLGTIGFEGRFDYAAIGTVSNVASRLCDEAKPGQILISPRVLMAVEKDITVEPVGDFALKGIRRPLMAYNVLAAKAAH